MDEYYLQLLGWMSSLTDSDLVMAMVYGIVSAALVTGGGVWFAQARRRRRDAQLRASSSRYIRLRPGR